MIDNLSYNIAENGTAFANLDSNVSSLGILLPYTIVESLDSLLISSPPPFKFSRCALLYLLSKIWKLTDRQKYRGLMMAPLYSRILKHEFGNKYRLYLNWLIDVNLIITDNHYITSSSTSGRPPKCKCYGFVAKYNRKDVKRFELNDNSITCKIAAYREYVLQTQTENPIVGHFYDMLKDFKVDYKGAEKHLKKLVKNGELSQNKADIELAKAKRINGDKEHPVKLFIHKDKYGRVHTNLTNMSRIVRDGFLTLDGEKTVGIDIRSSQPALFYTLCNQWKNKVDNTVKDFMWSDVYLGVEPTIMDDRKKYVNSKNKIIDTNPLYELKGMDSLTSTLGYTCYGNMLKALNKDLAKYKEWLSTDIYEKFVEIWPNFNNGKTTTRKKIKKQFITYLFGESHKPYMYKMNDIFNFHFPAIHQLSIHFKSSHHSHLAHSLQQLESDLVLNSVCGTVDKELSIPYGTVHDSLLVRERDYDNVLEIFNRILGEFGIESVAVQH